MTLIDAIFINNGGGKVLLDYLITSLCRADEKSTFTFLLDERLRHSYDMKKFTNHSVIFCNGFIDRSNYYRKFGNKFSKVLCFGNIPPNIGLPAQVYTYFHNPMYLAIPREFGLVQRLLFVIKTWILRSAKKNTNYWLVQNNRIKEGLVQKFSLAASNVWVVPFYPPLDPVQSPDRVKGTFIYVSNATPHKNHKLLITAFCKYFDEFQEGCLTVTVNNDYPDVVDMISAKIEAGYPIRNIGFVDRARLSQAYAEHEYLVFPSLAESFGLGIVEAIEGGCKVIGANLPYMHQVCTPSLVFDPQDEADIYQKLVESRGNVAASVQKIHNQIEDMVDLLK
ncbi:glycosyltransferase [Sphingobacterium paludis]|uniref:Glycosyl transferase family 1 n=1 Tax=Sphingobacterium paludis TaxID=1476465 RepID=A0A4R7CYM7_9SPHI|nr:glycosyltransferase [Sphingobacterium paludis]TDS13699.1 glycosyl transferase family 1 [Sphingobacterium paludis]